MATDNMQPLTGVGVDTAEKTQDPTKKTAIDSQSDAEGVIEPLSPTPIPNFTNTEKETTKDSIPLNTVADEIVGAKKQENIEALTPQLGDQGKLGSQPASTPPETMQPLTETKVKTKTEEVAKPAINEEVQAKIDEIAERERNDFLQDFSIKQQSAMDATLQSIKQDGFSGSGARNAVLALMNASSGRILGEGLSDLATKQMTTEFNVLQTEIAEQNQIDSEMRQYDMNLWASMSGDVEGQIRYAIMRAQDDPSNTFFAQFDDPDFQEIYRRNAIPEVQARKQEMKSLGYNLLERNINDLLYSPTGAKQHFGEWKNIVYSDAQELDYQAKAWGDSSTLETINKNLSDLGYETISDKSELANIDYLKLQDAYANSEYQRAVSDAIKTDVINRADSIMQEIGLDGVISAQEQKLMNDYMSVFATGMVDGTSMLGQEGSSPDDFDNFFIDWYGEPYSEGYSKEKMMRDAINGDSKSLVNQRYDALWTQYLQSRGSDDTLTRDEFSENEKIQALVFDSENSQIFTDQYAKQVIQGGISEGGFLKSTSIGASGLANDFGGDAIGTLANAINEDLSEFVINNQELLKESARSGEIPTVENVGSGFDYKEATRFDKDGNLFISPVFVAYSSTSGPDGQGGYEVYRTTDKLDDSRKTYFTSTSDDFTSDQAMMVNKNKFLPDAIEYFNELDSDAKQSFIDKSGGDIGRLLDLIKDTKSDETNKMVFDRTRRVF